MSITLNGNGVKVHQWGKDANEKLVDETIVVSGSVQHPHDLIATNDNRDMWSAIRETRRRALDEEYCDNCHEWKLLDQFPATLTNSSGSQPWCNQCLGLESCSNCQKWKSRDEFSPDPNNSSGVQSWCKQCRRDKEREKYAIKRNNKVRQYQRSEKQKRRKKPHNKRGKTNSKSDRK